jgi:hypothetical protein
VALKNFRVIRCGPMTTDTCGFLYYIM